MAQGVALPRQSVSCNRSGRLLSDGSIALGVMDLPLGNYYRTRAPHLDDFCQDTNADLLRRPGMNVEANRCMHPVQPLSRNTLGVEVLPDLGNPGLAAEHAQVAGWTIIDLL